MFAYIVVQQSILYVSIPSFFVAIFCSLLYVYQWKRYKVMMIIQHKIRIKFPIIHKILFLGSLDPVVKWLKAPGIILITMFFISYFFILIAVLFFVKAYEASDINTENAKRTTPNSPARLLEAEEEDSDAKIHAIVIPFLVSLLLL